MEKKKDLGGIFGWGILSIFSICIVALFLYLIFKTGMEPITFFMVAVVIGMYMVVIFFSLREVVRKLGMKLPKISEIFFL